MMDLPHRELVEGHIVEIDEDQQLLIDGESEPYTKELEKEFLTIGLEIAKRKIKSSNWPVE